MGNAFLHGTGGGAALNFKVAAYASAGSYPATAAENTIGIITTTAIPGYVFAPSEPDTAGLAAGTVWIKTGTSSAVGFNALKKNAIMIYPTACKQLVSGTWVDVTAKSFIGGAWVDWVAYLFTEDDGQVVPWVFSSYNSNGTVSEQNGAIVFSYSAVDNAYTAAGTENAVDLSGFTKLCFDVQVSTMYSSSEGPIVVGVTSAQVVAGYQKNTFTASATTEADSVRRTVTVDISDLSTGYISIHGLMKATVYNVWME